MFMSLIFGFYMVCRQYHGLIIRGHFGFERLILLLIVGESIVRSFSPWIWETYWEWGLGFLCTKLLGSLSTSPRPSYSDLLRFGILRISCSSLSHIAILWSQLVSSFSSIPIHHFFFYPRWFSSRFMNDVFFGVHHLSLDIVHLDVGLSHLTHMVLIFDIAHIEAWHYLLAI